MSVFVMQRIKVADGDITIKDLLGSLVRPHEVFRYNRDGEVTSRILEEVIDLRELGVNYDEQIKKGYRVKAFLKDKEEFLSKGFSVAEPAKDDAPDAYVTYSRFWDIHVADCLGMEQVKYSDDGTELKWWGNYFCNEDIAPAISKKFPEVKFELEEIVEYELTGRIVIQDGKLIERIK